MKHLILWLVLAATLAACSTRAVVVESDQVSTLNDPHWTIKSEPVRQR